MGENLDIKRAYEVEYVSDVHVENRRGVDVVTIVVDDQAIEQSAIRVLTEASQTKDEHQRRASNAGDGLAADAVHKALKRMGAYNPETEVKAVIDSQHNVSL